MMSMLQLFGSLSFIATHHSSSLLKSVTQCCVVQLTFRTLPSTITGTLDTRHPLFPYWAPSASTYTEESLISLSLTNISPRFFVLLKYVTTYLTVRQCLLAGLDVLTLVSTVTKQEGFENKAIHSSGECSVTVCY